MPCMCGDLYCGSCGLAQGNFKCFACGVWTLDGGCANPQKCADECEFMWNVEIEIDREYERMRQSGELDKWQE